MSSSTHAPPPGAPSRLLDSVRSALVLRHYSPKTVEAYVGWVRRFVLFHGRRHPSSLGASEVSAFLSHLAEGVSVSASTQNQALAALLFLYSQVLKRDIGSVDVLVRARGPERLPVVMSREEVRAVLARLEGVWQLMASLLYGSGVRLMECVSLRVKDVDLGGGQLMVRRGKGQKDRLTLLPQALTLPLRAHLESVRQRHLADRASGAGYVELPESLGVKYPHAGSEWPWQWVFPATRQYVHAPNSELRRHHLHESALQRAVHAACWPQA